MSVVPQDSLERFSFRIEPKKKQAIERAAVLRGLSLTDFAITILYREAQQILRSDEALVLDDSDRDAFLAALDNPPAPAPKAIRAARRYKQAKSVMAFNR
jgi:uncharacterized protein (DUF1778 family)